MSETSNLKIVAPDANSVLVPLHSHFAALASSVDKGVTDRFQVKHLSYLTTELRDAEYNASGANAGKPVDETTGKPDLVDGDMCLVIANKRQYIWNVNTSTSTKGWMLVAKRFVFASISERNAMLGEDIYEGDSCYITDLDKSYNYDGSSWVSTDGLVQIVPTGSQVVATGASGTGTVDDYGNINFSAVTSLQLNGIFTSRFKHYKMIFTADTSVSGYVNFRYVTGTTENSATTHFYTGFSSTSTATTWQSGSTTASNGRIGYASAGSGFANFMTFEIFNPQQAMYTRSVSSGGYNNVATQYTSTFNASTVFDGFRIIPEVTTTTFTGSLKIYGYN